MFIIAILMLKTNKSIAFENWILACPVRFPIMNLFDELNIESTTGFRFLSLTYYTIYYLR